MSKAIKFSLGVLVIFLGCIVLSVVGSNRSRISEFAAATPVLVPRVSAVPTATVAPTEENATDVTAAKRDYARQVLGPLSNMSNALGQVSELMKHATLTQDWNIALAAQFATIQNTHKELQAITPPVEMKQVHSRLLDVSVQCDEATVHAAKGIDRMNFSELSTANKLMDSCGAGIQQTIAMLNQ